LGLEVKKEENLADWYSQVRDTFYFFIASFLNCDEIFAQI